MLKRIAQRARTHALIQCGYHIDMMIFFPLPSLLGPQFFCLPMCRPHFFHGSSQVVSRTQSQSRRMRTGHIYEADPPPLLSFVSRFFSLLHVYTLS